MNQNSQPGTKRLWIGKTVGKGKEMEYNYMEVSLRRI
jgi:hypothetical protein